MHSIQFGLSVAGWLTFLCGAVMVVGSIPSFLFSQTVHDRTGPNKEGKSVRILATREIIEHTCKEIVRKLHMATFFFSRVGEVAVDN